jgi:hypothetical protein
VQRTEASRFSLRQIERQRRLAPVADLCVTSKQDEIEKPFACTKKPDMDKSPQSGWF